jgi:hypothetical protein
MPDIPKNFTVAVMGGMNVQDQSDLLMNRSHQVNQIGSQQVAPIESPNLMNIDFDTQGFRNRKGSTELDDLSSVMVSSEELIRGIEFTVSSDGSTVEVIVGKKSIYFSIAGAAWVQANNANGNAYTHNSDVSKVSFAVADGHLFIGVDGNNNKIQVYKGGTDLDCHLNNHTSSTTVDASSASGQKVLNVAATTMFTVGDRIVINEAGTPEYGYIDSIQAGVSLTLEDNLGASYTTETVSILNLYEEAFTTTPSEHEITGVWGDAYYILVDIHSRLAFSNGNTLIEYTPMAHTTSSGIWDLAGSTSGFFQFSGEIRQAFTFVPHLANAIDEVLYIGTSTGFEVTTGFEDFDRPVKIEGSKSPINHKAFAKAKNWVFYLSDERNIYGINGNRVIDIGRRLKTNAQDGPLDLINHGSSRIDATAEYINGKEQAIFFFTTNASYMNDTAVVIDLKLGEPVLGEPEPSFERKVRLLRWQINDPANNNWFTDIYNVQGKLLGITATGKTWQIDSGLDDLDPSGTTDGIKIDAYWYSPHITVFTFAHKGWIDYIINGIPLGDYPVDIEFYINRGTNPQAKLTFNPNVSVYGEAVYGISPYMGNATIAIGTDIDQYSQILQWRIRNSNLGETFLMVNQSIRYEEGVIER